MQRILDLLPQDYSSFYVAGGLVAGAILLSIPLIRKLMSKRQHGSTTQKDHTTGSVSEDSWRDPYDNYEVPS